MILQKISDSVAAPTAAFVLTVAWPLEAVGYVPAAVFMGAIGTAIGIFLDPPDTSRGRMFGLAICYTVLAAACALAIGHFPGLGFFKPIAPLIALLFAAFAQTLTPVLRAALARRAARTIGGDPPP